ncbi:hypothetical protein [Mucisphaera sp.]|uniref:hypothetical protein n=1 Tax=Mucisphaera sp. TaxID=2913024 RepID=UPI003D0FD859
MITVLAAEVVEECRAEGIELAWPGGSEPEEFESQADFPAGVWDEASARWEYMPEPERKQARQGIVDLMMVFANMQADELEASVLQEARSIGFFSTFGVMDLLFFGLAVTSAFKLGSGMGGEVT